MRRALVLASAALAAFFMLAIAASSADTFEVRLVSQTSSTITLGWDPQPGYGYLFSVNGSLVSRTNDANRSTVKFGKVANGVYEVAVIVKGATGVYPTAPPPPPKNQCEDAADNDGDGKVDFPADPGCASATDNDETDAAPPPPPTGYPDSSNTGVPAGTTLTAYTGPTTITVANTVITGKILPCMDINAKGVIIRNSRISCNGSFPVLVGGGNAGVGSVLIEDSDLDCKDQGGTAIAFSDVTARRVDIAKCENGFSTDQDMVIEDSYIHDLFQSATAHPDGIQCDCHNVTIRHNTIYGSSEVDGAQGNAALIFGRSSSDANILIENNLLAGGGYTVYCVQGAKGNNFVIRNNAFSTRFGPKVGFYGPAVDCADETQSGNFILETGQQINLG